VQVVRRHDGEADLVSFFLELVRHEYDHHRIIPGMLMNGWNRSPEMSRARERIVPVWLEDAFAGIAWPIDGHSLAGYL
jgi:hypothetical protein